MGESVSFSVPTAILAALTGSTILTFALLYVRTIPGVAQGMGYWVIGFGLNSLRLGFYYFGSKVGVDVATIVAESFQASQSFFIVAGALTFVGKSPPVRAIVLGCLISVAWAAAATFLNFGFLFLTVPLYGITGAAIIYSGSLLLKSTHHKAFEPQAFVRWALVLWGIHKWNFPFLRSVEWFAPWGFVIAQGLSMAIAIGVIVFVMRSLQLAVVEESSKRQEADTALVKSEQIYRSVIETAHDGFWIVNQDGFIEEVNNAYVKRSGFARGELIGKHVSEIDVGDTQSDVEARIRRILASGSELFVSQHRAKNGEIWDAEIGISCAGGEDKIRFFDFIRDITDRIRDERALIESERRFRRILEEVPLIAISLDLEGRIAFANDRFLTLAGWQKDDVLGKDWFETFIPAEISAKLGRIFRESVTSGGVGQFTTYENDILTRDGNRLLISWFNVASKNPDGTIHDITCFGRDVTEHQRQEQALKESENLYRSAFRISPDAVNINRLSDGLYVDINEGFTRLTGFTREDIEGRTSRDISIWADPKDRERLVFGLSESGVVENLEAKFRRKDGSLTVALMSARLIELAGERHILSITRDISDLREAEERLNQAQKMEAIGQLTGGIAHDFNNLLQVIETNLELARELTGSASPDATEMIDAALKSERRGAELTQKLLVFSRKHALHPKRFDACSWLAGEIKLLSRTLGEDIEIHTEQSTDVVAVNVDENTLTNALLNIAINARAAMPFGGTLTASTARRHFAKGIPIENDTLPPGDYVELAISDTGVGMPKETLQRAFEPFFTTKDVGEGSGLGLSMVYGFARQSGGTVTIESELGKGTTVRILLPAATDEATGVGSGRLERTATNHETKVLLVEDDAAVRKSTIRLLKAIGCEVVETDKAAPVADILKNNDDIELLISDVVLPGGVNGVEVAREAVALRPDLKVILVSGYPDTTLAKSGLSEANYLLLPKPFSRTALSEAIASAMGEKV